MSNNGAEPTENEVTLDPVRAGSPQGPAAEDTLARVRDLLFGEAQRSQEQRTDELARRFEDLLAAAETRLADGMRAARRELEEEADALRARVADLEEELARHGRAHVARTSLAAELEAMARRLRGEGPDHAA